MKYKTSSIQFSEFFHCNGVTASQIEQPLTENIILKNTRFFSLTLVHASVLILEYSELVNFAKFLEHGSQRVLFEVTRYLSHKEFDGAVFVAEGWRGRDWYQHFCFPRYTSVETACQNSTANVDDLGPRFAYQVGRDRSSTCIRSKGFRDYLSRRA